MPIYRFTGRVVPPFNDFTISGPITVDWGATTVDRNDPTISLVMKATLSITNGIIEVVCDSNLSGTDNFDGWAYRRAFDLSLAVVSIFAFGKGMGLSVALETVVKPDGTTYNIQEGQAHLQLLVTALRSRQDGGIDITSILPIVLSNPAIFVALTDLTESVSWTPEAPVKCGRAVDAIRHYMAPQNDRRAGWPAMRDNLNLSQAFLEFITENSKGPRHGDVTGTTVIDLNEIIRRSWIVMNRFLEFKKRGDQRLPLADFPLL
jgi:hypothetical protein